MAGPAYLVLSAVGPDRPGLVAGLSAYLAERGGNLEDSRMAVLGGAFGVMMLVSAEPAELGRIEAEHGALAAALGLVIHTARTTAPAADSGEASFQVTVDAADREGIVQAIANALYQIGGNIISLSSRVYPAPVSGAPLFHLELQVAVPSGSAARLAPTLAEVARVENLECEVSAAG